MDSVAVSLIVLGTAALAGCASTDARFAFRVICDGTAQRISPDTDYQRQASHPIDSGASRFHFPQASSEVMLASVVYEDAGHIRRVQLNTLLQSTGTHAFIVIHDGAIVDERYFNGYRRDSIYVSYSAAKSRATIWRQGNTDSISSSPRAHAL
jgi:hypothetical protein